MRSNALCESEHLGEACLGACGYAGSRRFMLTPFNCKEVYSRWYKFDVFTAVIGEDINYRRLWLRLEKCILET